jgi:glycosyltransferase involved in cell wall biosynthesis
MKIVFYNHTGMVSGAEKMLLLLLANLPGDRFASTLICPSEGTLQSQAQSLGHSTQGTRPIAARFTYNPLKIVGYLFSVSGAILDTRKKFVSLKPDLIHAATVRAGIVATVATVGTGIPLIWHIHDMLPNHPITWAVRSLAHSSKRIHLVACSQAAADTLQPFHASSKQVEVIPNGIPMNLATPTAEAVSAKRRDLGIAPSTFVVAIVGMICPRKGQLGLIRAFAKLKEIEPDSALLIVGSAIFNKDHEYLELLKKEAALLDLGSSVHFLGQRNDVPMLLEVMDILAVNSTAEPFGLVLLEAMRIGKPVLATDCGGPRELIEQGVSGEIVPIAEEAALVEALARLHNSPALRARYGAAGYEIVHRKFTQEIYIDRWIDRYDSMVSTTSSHLRAGALLHEGISVQTGSDS